MKIGIVGYQGTGKTTLFEWLSQTEADPALAHLGQSVTVPVPDPRVHRLAAIYQPKKVTLAGLELADTPGLAPEQEGNAAKLASIREAGCLVIVVPAFNGQDPTTQLANFRDDLLLADLQIVAGRIERVRDSLRKPRPNRDELAKELELLEEIHRALEVGTHLLQLELTPDQQRMLRSFQLFNLKPRFVVVNLADDEPQPEQYRSLDGETEVEAVAVRLQHELARLPADERAAFCEEMGVVEVDRGEILRRLVAASGQIVFFTAGEREVRSWMVRQGCTAVEAAAAIHTDLARGFVRAEVMRWEDLVRLGSEREVKAHNLVRRESKDYVIQDGDVIYIQHHS
ncbi:MAG: ribosome-binding ATPase YchF [Pirellulaceae bacterium]|nr:MAG: ribosome-binding ATPase YchF [Pirellulaceae bacterium]